MNRSIVSTTGCLTMLLFGALSSALPAPTRTDPIPFSDEYWDLSRARVFEHNGRQALTGIATLKGVEFQDGVIEVDIWAPHARSYPGVFFRKQSAGDYERFYVRPHRSGHYPDALQYNDSFSVFAKETFSYTLLIR